MVKVSVYLNRRVSVMKVDLFRKSTIRRCPRFTPPNPEFLKLTLPSISISGHFHCCQTGGSCSVKDTIANSLEPDETAHFEPSYLDLHCLQKYLS